MTSNTILNPQHIQTAVQRVYEENAGRSDPKQNSEDWGLCSDTRHELYRRVKAEWGAVSGQPERFFPWHIDAVLRALSVLPKNERLIAMAKLSEGKLAATPT